MTDQPQLTLGIFSCLFLDVKHLKPSLANFPKVWYTLIRKRKGVATMEMSYHCRIERANRVQHIVNEIGMGQVVKVKFVRYCYTCITDTGITIIKTADKLKVVTMYVTTYRELVAVYEGTKKIPPYLKKRVDRNQTYYIREGKTIWA